MFRIGRTVLVPSFDNTSLAATRHGDVLIVDFGLRDAEGETESRLIADLLETQGDAKKAMTCLNTAFEVSTPTSGGNVGIYSL